jgi:hypothetical protein
MKNGAQDGINDSSVADIVRSGAMKLLFPFISTNAGVI